MTTRSYSERDLTVWLEAAGQPTTPDYVDDLLARTARARQRPAWFPERWLPMDVPARAPTVAGRQMPLRMIALVGLLLVALLTGALLIAGAQRHVPAPFGTARNGLIAMVSPATQIDLTTFEPAAGDIVLVDPTTGTTRVLVGGPTPDRDPTFALDGTRLSFVRESEGGVSLYAIDVAGGQPRRLTDDPLPNIHDAAWSPDGSSVAFTSTEGGVSSLWIARTDGAGAKRIPLDVSVGGPQWRPPDGRQLLVVGSKDPGLLPGSGYQDLWGGREAATGVHVGLFLVRPDGSEVKAITPADGHGYDYAHTHWSPSGDRIVTQHGRGGFDFMLVRILTPEGVEIATIEPGAGAAETVAAEFSPDGRRLAYVDMAADQTWHLNVTGPDGGGGAVATRPTIGGAAAAYRWSPDGTVLVVNHNYYVRTWLIDPAGGAEHQAPWTDAGMPTWQRLAD